MSKESFWKVIRFTIALVFIVGAASLSIGFVVGALEVVR